jgi:hypothetical protein
MESNNELSPNEGSNNAPSQSEDADIKDVENSEIAISTPIYKRKWVWCIVAVVIVVILISVFSTTAKPAENTVLLSIPEEVLDAGVGAWDIQPGDDLKGFIKENNFISASWDSDNTLQIIIDEDVRIKELTSLKDGANNALDRLLDVTQDTDYVDCLYSASFNDDLTNAKYYVDSSLYNPNSPEAIQIEVSAVYYMSLYQVYNKVDNYAGSINIIDEDTRTAVENKFWPSLDYIYSNIDTDGANSSTETPIIEKTPQQQMLSSIVDLMSDDLAFDTGNYIAGDIPKGDYAFVKFDGSGSYYSEEDAAGNIVDNENFDSFGYATVHAVGNLETQGVLVNVTALEQLGVTGAKELYEILNEQTDYSQSGMYKIGVDLPAGKYTLESIGGSGYVAILSGPVSNNKIIDNENFDGKYSVNVRDGQYLQVSKAMIN